jgi:hypothetical protein
MGHRWVTIATVDSPVESALIKNLLEAAGIATFLADEDAVSMAWHLVGAMGGIKVQVAEQDVEGARMVLAERRPESRARRDRPPLSMRRNRLWRAATPELGEGAAEDQEEHTSPREKDADRALRAALVGVLLLPVQAYASWLLLKVVASRQALTGRSRRNAWIAAAINVAVSALVVLLVLAIFAGGLGFLYDDVNLRKLRHPERMVGVWQRQDPADQGGGLETLELRPDGRLRYRYEAAGGQEGSGTWGYEDNWFLFRLDRLSKGDWDVKGQLISWRLETLTEDEMTVKTGRGSEHFFRQGSPKAPQGR